MIAPSVRGIIATGYSDDDVVEGFASHGFSGAIVKPLRLEELSETILRILANPREE